MTTQLTTSEILEVIRKNRPAFLAKAVEELISFVSLPNNVYNLNDLEKNARRLKEMLEQRGIEVKLLPTESGRSIVYGELMVDQTAQTLLLYSHYDGVPVDEAAWHSNPYQPVLRKLAPLENKGDWTALPFPVEGSYEESWRLFGRSVADSKNAIVAILTALDLLHSQGLKPGVNLKFLFEGEEEEESPGLAGCLLANHDLLKADLLICASGEVHQSGLPTVQFGVRGALIFELTTYTALSELHSGHFGNFGPNAALRLAELLASFKDNNGYVRVEGFYDEVVALSESEIKALHNVPSMEQILREKFGIFRAELDGKMLQELINLPTFNVRGLKSGYTGQEARNIIPHQATASLDVRLVKGMNPQRVLEKIISHVEKQGWKVLNREPSQEELLSFERVIRVRKQAGFPATRTPFSHPVAQQVLKAVERVVDEPVLALPTDGGSLALNLFEEMGIAYLGIPTSNFDCNQHTSDENLHLKYFFRAIEIFASVMLG